MSYVMCMNKECAAFGVWLSYSSHFSHLCPVQCGAFIPVGDLVGVEPTAAYTLCKSSVDPGIAPAHVVLQMVRWRMKPRLATSAKKRVCCKRVQRVSLLSGVARAHMPR